MKEFGEDLLLTLPNATSSALTEATRLLVEKMGCAIVTPPSFGPDDGFAFVKRGDHEFVIGWDRRSGISIALRNRVARQLKEEAMGVLQTLRGV